MGKGVLAGIMSAAFKVFFVVVDVVVVVCFFCMFVFLSILVLCD